MFRKVLILGEVTITEYIDLERRLMQNGYLLLQSRDSDRWDVCELLKECDVVFLVRNYTKKDMNMVIVFGKPIISKMNYDVL